MAILSSGGNQGAAVFGGPEGGRSKMTKSRQHNIAIRMLLIALGAVGVSSSAYATALTVSGVYLQYWNTSPSVLFGAGGEGILFRIPDSGSHGMDLVHFSPVGP